MPWLISNEKPDAEEKALIGLICNYWFGFKVYDPIQNVYNFNNREPFTKLSDKWKDVIIQTFGIRLYTPKSFDIVEFQTKLLQEHIMWQNEISKNSHNLASHVIKTGFCSVVCDVSKTRNLSISVISDQIKILKQNKHVSQSFTVVHSDLQNFNLTKNDEIDINLLREGAVSIILDSNGEFSTISQIVNLDTLPIRIKYNMLFGKELWLSPISGIHFEIWRGLLIKQGISLYNRGVQNHINICTAKISHEKFATVNDKGALVPDSHCAICGVLLWYKTYMRYVKNNHYKAICIICTHYGKQIHSMAVDDKLCIVDAALSAENAIDLLEDYQNPGNTDLYRQILHDLLDPPNVIKLDKKKQNLLIETDKYVIVADIKSNWCSINPNKLIIPVIFTDV